MDEMLTVKQVAERWSIAEYAVYRMIRYGRLTPHELPLEPWQKRKRIVLDPSEVEAVLGPPKA
jgi:hypothetical protein